MGEVRVAIVVENPRTGARSDELIALAGTGATLTVVPAGVLQRLAVPTRRRVVPRARSGRPRPFPTLVWIAVENVRVIGPGA